MVTGSHSVTTGWYSLRRTADSRVNGVSCGLTRWQVKVVGMEELGSRLAVLTSDGWLRVLELQHESLRGGLSDWFRMQGRDEQGRRLMPKTKAPAGGSSRPKTGTSR